MFHLRQKIALLLIFALLQFFVPIFNVVAELSCCESREMACCQSEYPVRIVCCVSHADRAFDSSIPVQAMVQKKKDPTGLIDVSFVCKVSLQSLTNANFKPTEFCLQNNLCLTSMLYEKYSSYLN